MKKFISSLILLTGISVTSCGQEKYDFAEITQKSDINTFLNKIQKENEEVKIDTVYSFNELTIEGMHYAGTPIMKALVTDNYMILTTDTINYSGRKILETVEAKYGLSPISDGYSNDIEFDWKQETQDIKLVVKLKNGKHLAAMGDKDNAELTISYKTLYNLPIANLHKEIKTYPNAPKYILKIKEQDCDYDIIVNGIKIPNAILYSEIFLNEYITNEKSSLEFIIKPNTQNENSSQGRFNDDAHFSAVLYDFDTEEIYAEINNLKLSGTTPVNFSNTYDLVLPFYPKAWTDGVDLRKDKNLVSKINALYTKIGKAVLANNEQAINDLFYESDLESQQIAFDTDFETARENWEEYVSWSYNSYKYTIAKDIEIQFYDGGKLVYVYPEDKEAMLILTGKKYSKKLNYFLYQPKGTSELKVIRQ
ncbi:hypothetical protein Celal_2690 [Cellulophaga algicola DSM 14237]|uniref:Lipoprotein n=1 Tax=Cellulophaga algicola (strain DSM 14237 / IC166 / ACAM 630) TaxID=688270 RepID=E6XBB1_CELAD|nr:hypothetical protein [Cellulophaga algicola]ADV49975.1 hypothetical protein Celal_2690 [Cellulophaga algicola DSM 14237]